MAIHLERITDKLAPRMMPTEADYLSPAEIEELTPELVIERITALKPFIAEHAREAELRRMPVQKVWTAICRTGFFYMCMLKKYGGLEASWDQIMDAVMPICEADPSTGWICSFMITNPRSASIYPQKAQNEMFKDGHFVLLTSVLNPPGKAVKVDAGYRVTGTWAWSTTIQLANWFSGAAMADTPEGPRLGSFLIPAEQVDIMDTWDSHGLIATGTHHTRVNDLFVPDHRMTWTSVTSPEWQDLSGKLYHYPLYKAPVIPALALTIGMADVGIAKGALAVFEERIKTHNKSRKGPTDTDAFTQLSQVRLARAMSKIHAGELLVRDAARLIFAQIGKSRAEALLANQQARAWVAEAAVLARDAVTILVEAGGTGIHYMDHPMQRILRDIYVGASHAVLDYDICMEQYGRLKLGLDPNSTLL